MEAEGRKTANNRLKTNVFYVFLAVVFGILIFKVLSAGKLLEGIDVVDSESSTGHWETFLEVFRYNLHHPLAVLLLQIIVIVFVAKSFGAICKMLKQPSVIGEMLAGIVLGPSLFGLLFPEISLALFPPSSLGNLQLLSQIGLILFMFIIGLELDLKIIRSKTSEAVIISHASIILPFTLGVSLSYLLYSELAPSGVGFLPFALFMGVAMSVTAFPVLASIVRERKIHKTKLGALVITCAAVDDITAWCVLAAVIAIVKAGSFVSSLYSVLLSIIYIALMLKVIAPVLARFIAKAKDTRIVVAVVFLVVISSAYVTELTGIHALFGAFLAGVIIPEDSKFRDMLIQKVEDLSLVLLLPLFFVFTGLRTQIGLVFNSDMYLTTCLIIAVAVAGKFLGSALVARYVGQDWRTSLSIGALMNTRGLMELVVLNIGYDLGVLSTEVFSMMVIMTLVTTMMTGPSLDIINYVFDKFTKSHNNI